MAIARRMRGGFRGALLCLLPLIASCATAPASGPSSRSIANLADQSGGAHGISVIDVTQGIARAVSASDRYGQFCQSLGDAQPIGTRVGKGDILDVAIWEAAPAVLFGVVGGDVRSGFGGGSSRSGALPEQMVNSDGNIVIPFIGNVRADGRTPQEIAGEITRRLSGKAHRPQVLVRLVRNAHAAVTVIGDVNVTSRVALTPKGERVLDVLASSGGVKQPLHKTVLQITRGNQTETMPLETIIRNPVHNITMAPDDVLSVLFQNQSFVSLGAGGRSDEIPFEATGISLAQALGRIAGLQDHRADIKGVFIFRFEQPAVLTEGLTTADEAMAGEKVPVIYRINMKDPAMMLIAQSFPIRDRDVLYISNAPLADFQKFINVLYSTVLPVATTMTVTQ